MFRCNFGAPSQFAIKIRGGRGFAVPHPSSGGVGARRHLRRAQAGGGEQELYVCYDTYYTVREVSANLQIWLSMINLYAMCVLWSGWLYIFFFFCVYSRGWDFGW